MIDFWIFPLSTIWGAYQNTGVVALFYYLKIMFNFVQLSEKINLTLVIMDLQYNY